MHGYRQQDVSRISVWKDCEWDSACGQPLTVHYLRKVQLGCGSVRRFQTRRTFRYRHSTIQNQRYVSESCLTPTMFHACVQKVVFDRGFKTHLNRERKFVRSLCTLVLLIAEAHWCSGHLHPRSKVPPMIQSWSTDCTHAFLSI